MLHPCSITDPNQRMVCSIIYKNLSTITLTLSVSVVWFMRNHTFVVISLWLSRVYCHTHPISLWIITCLSSYASPFRLWSFSVFISIPFLCLLLLKRQSISLFSSSPLCLLYIATLYCYFSTSSFPVFVLHPPSSPSSSSTGGHPADCTLFQCWNFLIFAVILCPSDPPSQFTVGSSLICPLASVAKLCTL